MKRDPRLRGQSEDHHHALFLARRIRFALEEGERQLAEELTASGWTKELAPHLEAEEEVLVHSRCMTSPGYRREITGIS